MKFRWMIERKKTRSRIITFSKTEGEREKLYSSLLFQIGNIPEAIYVFSALFFRRFFLIHYRFPQKHETGSRNVNYIFVPYLHDHGPPYLSSPFRILSRRRCRWLKAKFWYTVESMRFLYRWKGREDIGQRADLYESNETTMFRNKKERGRIFLLEETNFSKNPWWVKGSLVFFLVGNLVY